MYGDETCVCYDIQILSVYMELIYKINCNVRISGRGKKSKPAKQLILIWLL